MGKADNNRGRIDIGAMRDASQLNTEQWDLLNVLVTESEILVALKSIGDIKYPCVNGYSVYFFKKAWNIISRDVIEVIQDFFLNVKLYKVVNFSIITLIPKHNEAKSIKGYKPIAFCSTLYKIISKVLANRMSQVLGTIVGHNPVMFVKGNNIHNRIVLT